MTAIATRVICGTCRHPRPLHSSDGTGCMAKGCHAGPDDGPCEAFTPADGPVVPPAIPAVAFVAPQVAFREAV
jgi:hypothetical protein